MATVATLGQAVPVTCLSRNSGFARDPFGQYRTVWHGSRTSAGLWPNGRYDVLRIDARDGYALRRKGRGRPSGCRGGGGTVYRGGGERDLAIGKHRRVLAPHRRRAEALRRRGGEYRRRPGASLGRRGGARHEGGRRARPTRRRCGGGRRARGVPVLLECWGGGPVRALCRRRAGGRDSGPHLQPANADRRRPFAFPRRKGGRRVPQRGRAQGHRNRILPHGERAAGGQARETGFLRLGGVRGPDPALRSRRRRRVYMRPGQRRPRAIRRHGALRPERGTGGGGTNAPSRPLAAGPRWPWRHPAWGHQARHERARRADIADRTRASHDPPRAKARGGRGDTRGGGFGGGSVRGRSLRPRVLGPSMRTRVFPSVSCAASGRHHVLGFAPRCGETTAIYSTATKA